MINYLERKALNVPKPEVVLQEGLQLLSDARNAPRVLFGSTQGKQSAQLMGTLAPYTPNIRRRHSSSNRPCRSHRAPSALEGKGVQVGCTPRSST